jgi:hypothetical protein
MSKPYSSPLSEADLDTLNAFARKVNATLNDPQLAPMFCAADCGDFFQRDAYLFLAWPASHLPARRAADQIFNAIASICFAELNAVMQQTRDRGEDK